MKKLALILALLLTFAAFAFAGRNDTNNMSACMSKPTLMQRGTSVASHVGSIVPALQKPLPLGRMTEIARGAWHTIGFWFGVFGAAVQGHPTPDPVMLPLDCGNPASLDQCNPPTPPPNGGTEQPFNPKDASLQGLGGNSSTVDDAIVQTAIRIGRERGIPERGWVVILAAGYQESGIRNLSYGDRDSVGWLQQRAGWGSVSQRMDPAYATNKFYDALVKVSGWQSMSINDAAQRVQISGTPTAYAKWETAARNLVASTPSAPNSNPSPTTPPPECAAGGSPATVGQWNILFSNSPARVNANAGFADLVCLNEIRHNSALKIPGYQVTPGSMAVPIIWRPSNLDKVELHRTTVLTGYARDKSAVHGVWRNRSTGKEFAAICTHMLVQGGTGWHKQAVNVSRIRASYQRRGLPVIILADMNAPQSKVLGFFAGKPLGGRIDFLVGFGVKPEKMEVLSNAGSDHARRRWTFPPEPGTTNAGAGDSTVGGGVAPSRFDQQGNPRTVEQAIAWIKSYPNGALGEPVANRCERYMNLAYGLGAGYPTARAHWEAPGVKGQGDPPRGALVFWNTSNSAGHVALSLGGGRVISTDFDGTNFRSGVISEGPIEQIDKWGTRLGWRAPNFNVGSGQ